MHRYRIIAQTSLIFSIFNLILASPVVVRKIHEARGDEMVVVEDVAAMVKKWRKLEAASDKSPSPRSSQPEGAMTSPQPEDGSTPSGPSQHEGTIASLQPEDTMASPQPEVGSTPSGPSQPEDAIASPRPEDGSTSSGSSQYKDAMTFLHPEDGPTSLASPQYEDAIASPQPEVGSTSSGSSQYKDAMTFLHPEDGPTPLGPSQHEDAMASPQHEDGSASSGYEYPIPHLSSGSSDSGYSWLVDRPSLLSLNRPAPLNDLQSTSETLPPPSQPHLSSDGSPPSPHLIAGDWPSSSPSTEPPPGNAGFFDKEGLKYFAGGAVGGAIISIAVAFGIKHYKEHHKSKDDRP